MAQTPTHGVLISRSLGGIRFGGFWHARSARHRCEIFAGDRPPSRTDRLAAAFDFRRVVTAEITDNCITQ
jgi:hypothetical protein